MPIYESWSREGPVNLEFCLSTLSSPQETEPMLSLLWTRPCFVGLAPTPLSLVNKTPRNIKSFIWGRDLPQPGGRAEGHGLKTPTDPQPRQNPEIFKPNTLLSITMPWDPVHKHHTQDQGQGATLVESASRTSLTLCWGCRPVPPLLLQGLDKS